jgi:hypothetical protein
MFDSLLSLNFITILLIVCFVTVIGVNIVARIVSGFLSAYIRIKRL